MIDSNYYSLRTQEEYADKNQNLSLHVRKVTSCIEKIGLIAKERCCPLDSN